MGALVGLILGGILFLGVHYGLEYGLFASIVISAVGTVIMCLSLALTGECETQVSGDEIFFKDCGAEVRCKGGGAKFNTLGVIRGLHQHFTLVSNILVLFRVTFNTI